MKKTIVKRNIVTPYNALFADIKSFIAKLDLANRPKTVSRGTLAASDLALLHECVTTAEKLGYRVEARAKDSKTLEFFLVQITAQPTPNWNWR